MIADIEKRLPELKLFVQSMDQPKEITERVKSFDDALKIYINQFGPLSPAKKSLLEYLGDDKDVNAAQGFLQVSIIRAVLNEGWVPDWTKSSQAKYYPWFDFSSGSGLSYDGYGYDGSYSYVGSRLCYKTSALAIYAGKQFSSIYAKFMIL